MAFRERLAEAGFFAGRNVAFERRSAEEDYQRLPDLAADLVRRQVDVIVAAETPATLAAKAATRTIPIVFITGADPVQIGLVNSLNRPGGNLTGVAILTIEMVSKRLELVREVAPTAASVGYLSNPGDSPSVNAELTAAETAARILGLKLLILKASTAGQIETAFEDLVRQRAGALVVSGDDLLDVGHRDQIAALALRYRLPTIFDLREAAAAGALLSYAANPREVGLLAGTATGRILKGAKPADLPVQQVTKVEFVINLKTAKALGLTIPTNLLVRADEVIE
jgi:putative tryptophan/tyrosine transport system substrate-binding protein